MSIRIYRILVKALARDTRGVTAVEFAVVGPVLLLFLAGLLETGLMFAADAVLRHATDEAARVGRTGYVGQESTQAETIRESILEETNLLMDPDRLTISSAAYSGFDTLRQPEPFVDANGNGTRDDGENFTDVNGNGVYDLDQGTGGYGQSSQVVAYTVSYPWTFSTPLIGQLFSTDGVVRLTATAVVKNEPY